MNLVINSAVFEDYDTLNVIVKEGQDEHADALPNIFNKVRIVMPKSYFKELLEDSNTEILVARENEKVVGFAVMELKESPPFDSVVPRKYAYMSDFGVKGSHQKRGIGKDLFDACVNWSKNQGASSLELNVWEFNQKAISFYSKNGMKSISRKMTLLIDDR
ncbi:GNAT family N-acetyltransferase [Peribacillus sp. NPDC096379]|uniref:GNAT family N-acetyltransferase n=1 Tax=Peribacillus sp. NPDC096379 TaxID=3364393 RepID=UPI0037FE4F88